MLDIVFSAIIFLIGILHQSPLVFQIGELGLRRSRLLPTFRRLAEQFALYIHLLGPLSHDFLVRETDDKIFNPRVAFPKDLDRVRPFRASVPKQGNTDLIRISTSQLIGALTRLLYRDNFGHVLHEYTSLELETLLVFLFRDRLVEFGCFLLIWVDLFATEKNSFKQIYFILNILRGKILLVSVGSAPF